MPGSWLARISPFLVSFAVTCTFFINFCSWIFQCGCRSLWAGSAMACNIHAAHGRHCPWCSHGYTGYAVVMALMTAPQLAVTFYGRWNWPVRTMAAVAMFPISGLAIAWVFGLMDAYWKP
jgi:hypothetical protein